MTPPQRRHFHKSLLRWQLGLLALIALWALAVALLTGGEAGAMLFIVGIALFCGIPAVLLPRSWFSWSMFGALPDGPLGVLACYLSWAALAAVMAYVSTCWRFRRDIN